MTKSKTVQLPEDILATIKENNLDLSKAYPIVKVPGSEKIALVHEDKLITLFENGNEVLNDAEFITIDENGVIKATVLKPINPSKRTPLSFDFPRM